MEKKKVLKSRFVPNSGKFNFLYKRFFINKEERQKLELWLQTLRPLWENRFSLSNPPPAGDEQRELLRPVYWLGNWQFACLDYYHPPKGIHHRCVRAEGYPPLLASIVKRIEILVREVIPKTDIPTHWELNTCLINFYGRKQVGEKWQDVARVGEHKDFEPGPVASLSIGEKAFFQFVWGNSNRKDNVREEMWLEDSSLLVFAGELWKEKLFHRVQRVESKNKKIFQMQTTRFETRRINFTFRYVPREHITELKEFPGPLKVDVKDYVNELALSSEVWKKIAEDAYKN